jgi:lysozyme family protein
MAIGNFAACNRITRGWEGGDVNHPKDPGGLTSRGVTAARGNAWRKSQGLGFKVVTSWSDAEVDDFYRSEFWRAMNCEGLDAGVDLATYDGGVNSGPARSLRWLMASLGGTTIETIKAICGKRLGFVHGLKTWKTFGKGWTRRIAGIEASAVSMWLASQKIVRPDQVLDAEAHKADEKAATQGKGSVVVAAGGGAGASGTSALDLGAYYWWVIATLVVVGLGAAAVLAIKSSQNTARSAAYAAEAKRVRLVATSAALGKGGE